MSIVLGKGTTHSGASDAVFYDAIAEGWWRKGAPEFRSLHSVNRYRMELLDSFAADIRGQVVCDLGAGGGILSKGLIDRGAAVIACDLSVGSLRAGEEYGLAWDCICADILRIPVKSESADLVCLCDILEHVRPLERVFEEVSRILKPGGHVFVHTINRTLLARIFALWIAEGLGLVPWGTHSYDYFVTPEEISQLCESTGLSIKSLQGERPRIFETASSWALSLERSKSTAVSYAMWISKS